MLGRCLVLVSSATTCCCSFLPECYWQRGGYEGISLLKCSHDWGSKVHWEHTRKNRKKRDWYWKTFCLKAYSLKKKSGNRLIKELTCFKNSQNIHLMGHKEGHPKYFHKWNAVGESCLSVPPIPYLHSTDKQQQVPIQTQCSPVDSHCYFSYSY